MADFNERLLWLGLCAALRSIAPLLVCVYIHFIFFIRIHSRLRSLEC